MDSFVRALNERPVNALNGLMIFYAASAAAAPNRGGNDDYPMAVDGHRSDVDDNSTADNRNADDRTADNSAAAATSTSDNAAADTADNSTAAAASGVMSAVMSAVASAGAISASASAGSAAAAAAGSIKDAAGPAQAAASAAASAGAAAGTAADAAASARRSTAASGAMSAASGAVSAASGAMSAAAAAGAISASASVCSAASAAAATGTAAGSIKDAAGPAWAAASAAVSAGAAAGTAAYATVSTRRSAADITADTAASGAMSAAAAAAPNRGDDDNYSMDVDGDCRSDEGDNSTADNHTADNSAADNSIADNHTADNSAADNSIADNAAADTAAAIPADTAAAITAADTAAVAIAADTAAAITAGAAIASAAAAPTCVDVSLPKRPFQMGTRRQWCRECDSCKEWAAAQRSRWEGASVQWKRTLVPPGTCAWERLGPLRRRVANKVAIRVAQGAAAIVTTTGTAGTVIDAAPPPPPPPPPPPFMPPIVDPSDAAAAALRKVLCPRFNGRRRSPILFNAAAAHALLANWADSGGCGDNGDAGLLLHAAAADPHAPPEGDAAWEEDDCASASQLARAFAAENPLVLHGPGWLRGKDFGRPSSAMRVRCGCLALDAPETDRLRRSVSNGDWTSGLSILPVPNAVLGGVYHVPYKTSDGTRRHMRVRKLVPPATAHAATRECGDDEHLAGVAGLTADRATFVCETCGSKSCNIASLIQKHAKYTNKVCDVAPPRVHVAEDDRMSATIPLPRNPGVFARNAPDAEEVVNALRAMPVVQVGEVLTPAQAGIPLAVVDGEVKLKALDRGDKERGEGAL